MAMCGLLSLDFYRPYFDVDTSQVKTRLFQATWPKAQGPPFLDDADAAPSMPDMYGPVWVSPEPFRHKCKDRGQCWSLCMFEKCALIASPVPAGDHLPAVGVEPIPRPTGTPSRELEIARCTDDGSAHGTFPTAQRSSKVEPWYLAIPVSGLVSCLANTRCQEGAGASSLAKRSGQTGLGRLGCGPSVKLAAAPVHPSRLCKHRVRLTDGKQPRVLAIACMPSPTLLREGSESGVVTVGSDESTNNGREAFSERGAQPARTKDGRRTVTRTTEYGSPVLVLRKPHGTG